MSRDLEASVTACGLDDRDSDLDRDRDFLLRHYVKTGSGAHPVSYPICTRGIKHPEIEADHSLPPNAEIKNA
jgi:hypothetical protein